MRITKVDSFAKMSLRVFATLGEAKGACFQQPCSLDRGWGAENRKIEEWYSFAILCTFTQAKCCGKETAAASRGVLKIPGFGGFKKKPQHFCCGSLAKGEAIFGGRTLQS